MIRNNLAGQRFGALTVLDHAGTSPGRISLWRCACDCGAECVVYANALTQGRQIGCGCQQRITAAKTGHNNISHGMYGTREYRTWAAMIQRCTNPHHEAYANYGGRGITVCARWLNSFEAFFEDMGERPPGTTLDRVKNHLGYNKKNCRWATRREQTVNRRNIRMITYAGETLPAPVWADRTGISSTTINRRIKKGWSVERALTQPERQYTII